MDQPVTDVIDAIDAATADDSQAVALLIARLPADQRAGALSAAVGVAAGCICRLAALTGTEPQEWIRGMRRQAAP